MRVAVIGATGMVGQPTAELLSAAGHEVRRLSRGDPRYPVDLATGAGLEHALADVDAVVNAANGPASRRAAPVLVDGTTRALAATSAHHVCVSIIGIDELAPMLPYYRVKVDQERAVRGSDRPFTVVRATQFHEFVARPLRAIARGRMQLRSGVLVQPIAAAEAAAAIVTAVEAGPREEIVCVAGPEVLTVTQMATGQGLPVPLVLPPRIGRALRSGALTDLSADVRGTTTWGQWLAVGGD